MRAKLASIGIFVFGCALRLHYALSVHHLRHSAGSDALTYLESAQRLLSPGPSVDLFSTVWPPGTAALWAALSALDPTQGAAALFNALSSLAVPLLIAGTARLLGGPRAGWIALALASVHPGLLHYTGFALAEQPFQLAVNIALYLTLAALIAAERSQAPGLRAALAVSCAWGLAVLFRTNALPVFACGALAVGLARPARDPLLRFALGCCVGLALVLGAAAHSCTATAGGRFCLVSNNAAMNMALGQAGPFFGLDFIDPARPAESTSWVPPALLHHGYTGKALVPATIYDTAGVLRWFAGRFWHEPFLSVVRAFGNALDLFGLSYWPPDFGSWNERVMTVWTQAFSIILFVPALLFLVSGWRVAQPALRFVLGGVIGLLLSAALSLGEARYRIPFDGLWIALASLAYARVRPGEGITVASAQPRWLFWAGPLALCAATLLAISHPRLRLGTMLPQRATPLAGSIVNVRAADYAGPRAAMSRWDEPGNYVWQCKADCPELRLAFAAPVPARLLRISLDHNDRYRVLFYRAGKLLGYRDVGLARGAPPGMRLVTLNAYEGYDALGVLPLYGDGRYSLGHVAHML